MLDLLNTVKEALEEALAEAVTQELPNIIIELEYAVESLDTALILTKVE